MNHIGSKTIETERLILRPFKITDAKAMYKNWASYPEVTKYLRWKAHKSVEESKNICAIWEKESKNLNNYQWAIVLKELNEPVGSIGLVIMNDEKKMGEVGFCIGQKFWGKGLMKEACLAMLQYLEPVGFVRYCSCHHLENVNSGKVLMKCGFQKEGILRKSELNNNGELEDAVMYSLIKE